MAKNFLIKNKFSFFFVLLQTIRRDYRKTNRLSKFSDKKVEKLLSISFINRDNFILDKPVNYNCLDFFF